MQRTTIYWIAGIGTLAALLWLLRGILAPFVFGAIIAYFLDPVADWFEKKGLKRLPATALVTLLAFIVVLSFALIVLPPLVWEFESFLRSAPEMLENLRSRLSALPLSDLRSPDSAAAAKDIGLGALQGLLSGGAAVLHTLAVVFIAPVIAFYLLLDWDRMIADIDDSLPRDHAPVIRLLAGRIDKVLAEFLRGQLLVCIILGAFYAISMGLIGLKYGLLVGLVAGVISFIPFVGSLTGFVLAMALAVTQFQDNWLMIGIVAGIFVVGQLVEGNILTPKLVGGSVGLHPVWLLFALSAFGTLLGFAGLVLAVPMAAALGVLARYGLERYRESEYYSGSGGP